MVKWVKNLRYSIISKLILSICAIYLVSISVWAYFNIRIQKEKTMSNLLKDTARLCDTIKLGTHYAMMTNSRDDINQIINNVAKQEEIINIRIYNKKGQIKFSNDREEVDKFTNIKAEACYVCHKTEPPAIRLELVKRKRVFEGQKGNQYLGIITGIENEPGCSAGGCHFHKKDQQVLGAIDVVFSLVDTNRQILMFERGIIALAFFVVLLTSGILTFLMQNLLRKPIRKLIDETYDISKGDYHTTLEVRSNDEIGRLARAINRMAKEISGKQAELYKQKEEYQNLFEHVPCEITVQDRSFRLLKFNSNFAEKFNPDIGEFCYYAYKGSYKKCENCPVEKTFQDGLPHYGEETGINKFGEETHWILATAPIRNAKGEIVAAMEMSIDITNTRLLETRLEESEKKYQAIFNNIPNPVFVLDSETLEIVDCNKSVQLVYGYERSDVVHTPFADLFFEEEKRQYRERLPREKIIDRAKQRHKNGKTIFVNIRISPSESQGRKVYLVTTSDITKRLEAEQQLIQASKMATLGEMATGIAHELNQPLSVIKTASIFFIKKIRKNEPIESDIQITLAEEIDSHVNRATKIINHMREFGRKADNQLEPVEINSVIKKAFEIFSQQLKLRGIEVVWETKEDIPRVMAEAGRLEQVFINLLINARDAIEDRWNTHASPRYQAEEAEGQKPDKRIFIRTGKANDRVVAEIEDTGKGIPEELVEKIFEPFFTTKEVGKGTGLGLSISYGIIQDCRGHIQALSPPGKGACFRVSFPVPEEDAQNALPDTSGYFNPPGKGSQPEAGPGGAG